MMEILRNFFLKVLVKYTLRIEVWLWKLLSQHFQFKRFQDEKMESAHSAPKPINLKTYWQKVIHNMFV